MSDLISRSELLKAMNTWDKFGYDCHRGLVRIDSTNEEYVPYVRYEDMVNCVMNMPTAYDVDKVVEELPDDVCEWEKGSSGYVGYPAYYSKCCTTNSNGLEMQTHIIAGWKYCPYCGKKIKAGEDNANKI